MSKTNQLHSFVRIADMKVQNGWVNVLPVNQWNTFVEEVIVKGNDKTRKRRLERLQRNQSKLKTVCTQ
jgi:hypothetical protein